MPLLILALVMTGVRTYAYLSAKSAVRHNIGKNLEAIARLKQGQIEQWQAERIDDAHLILTQQFSSDLRQWLALDRRDQRLEQRLLAQLKFLGSSHYIDLSLLSPLDGSLLLTTNRHPDLPATRAQALTCVKTGKLTVEDIHSGEIAGNTTTTSGLFYPVRNAAGDRILAVLHLTLDPAELLFPLLQAWPDFSKSAEILLVRREGNEVVFLNKPRHLSITPLRLHHPLAPRQFITARVIEHGTGFYEGNDYRGVPSLAYGMAVTGTPWYLIAKIDEAEAYAELDTAMTYTSLALVLMLMACAWWLIRRRHREQLLRTALAESEDLYQNAACGYHSLDRNGVFVRINDTELRMLGYRREELIGKKQLQELLTPESVGRFKQGYPLFMVSGRVQGLELEFYRKGGTILTALISGTAIKDKNGRYLMSRTTVYDITERKQAETDLRIAAVAFESQEAIIVTNSKSIILRANRAFTETTGYTAEELVGKTPRLLRSERHGPDFFRDMWATIRRTGSWQGEIWDRRKNGEVYPQWLTISAVKNDAGLVTHYIGIHTDITERKKAEEKINELAFFDQLTGLPNRTLLLDRLSQTITASVRNDTYSALLFIDLDNFKTLNDSLGHDLGDQLLKQVARRLLHCVREGDTVARLGGDEFVVVLTGLSTDEVGAANDAETVAAKIIASLNQTYQLNHVAHHCTASIGVTLFMGEQVTIDDLLKQADLAMYKAKAGGRNLVRFFDPTLEVSVKERAALEEDLRRGLEQNQFLLHYQPVMDEDRLTGAEVLLRWQHPRRGMIMPSDFIPLAEDTGLILPLGQWVLQAACRQLATWAGRPGMAGLKVAVNVSVHQFRQQEFIEQMREILAASGANPRQLKLELTESLLVENIQDIIEKMLVLKAMGVGFSLDDFGIGYSSLSYLRRLPLDDLKIDRSFVREVLTDQNDAVIAKTIVALAQNLGLSVIAEGVENEAQRSFLVGTGCHVFQGYLFSRPLPLGEFERFAQRPEAAWATTPHI